MTVHVRSATDDDVEGIAAIDSYVVLHPGARDRFLRSLRDGDVLVAEDNSRLTGFMALERGFYGHTFVAFLSVDANERRRGIASLLLTVAETRAQKGKVFASTTASNEAMQAVFARNGWRRVGSLIGLNDDHSVGDEEEIIYLKVVEER